MSSAEMKAHCRIDKNSGSGEVEGTIEFTQQVCMHSSHFTDSAYAPRWWYYGV